MKTNLDVKVKTLRAYKLVADKARSDKRENLPVLDGSIAAYRFLYNEVYDRSEMDVVESFYAVYLNAANEVKGYIKVSSGGVNNCLADPKIIFGAALKCLAVRIIVSHNHPSGSSKPSTIDRELTEKLIAAGKLLDIRVTDHIIIGLNGYYSFLEHGEINF